MFALFVSLALNFIDYPSRIGAITDLANVISESDKNQINQIIDSIDENQQISVNVVTVPSLQGQSVEEYTRNLANSWGANAENGSLMILVAPKERKTRIEISKKLTSNFSVSKSDRIIKNNMPKFKQNLSSGVLSIVKDVNDVINIKSVVANPKIVDTNPKIKPTNSEINLKFMLIIFLACLTGAILIILIYFYIRNIERRIILIKKIEELNKKEEGNYNISNDIPEYIDKLSKICPESVYKKYQDIDIPILLVDLNLLKDHIEKQIFVNDKDYKIAEEIVESRCQILNSVKNLYENQFKYAVNNYKYLKEVLKDVSLKINLTNDSSIPANLRNNLTIAIDNIKNIKIKEIDDHVNANNLIDNANSNFHIALKSIYNHIDLSNKAKLETPELLKTIEKRISKIKKSSKQEAAIIKEKFEKTKSQFDNGSLDFLQMYLILNELNKTCNNVERYEEKSNYQSSNYDSSSSNNSYNSYGGSGSSGSWSDSGSDSYGGSGSSGDW